VPESHRELRAIAELDQAARARADAISAELTRPPSWFMRFWMGAGMASVVLSLVLLVVWILVSIAMCIGEFVSAGIFGAAIMLLVGLVLGMSLLYDEALHGLAEPLGVDLADVWSGAGSHGLLGLSFFVLLAVPLVLAAYAESFESVRATLCKVLSAPPTTEGGASECRACGAPLGVPEATLHVRCIYCHADNLVDVPDARRRKAAEDTEIVCRDLDAASLQERTVAARGRVLVAIRLAKALVLVPAFVLLGRCVAAVNEDDATFWQPAVASAPMLPRIEENPPLERGRATSFTVHETFDGCDEVDCWARYFVALEAGEGVEIVVEEGDLRLVEIARRDVGPWYDPTYQWRPMEPGTRAPYTGWYRVTLATAKRRGATDPRVIWNASR